MLSIDLSLLASHTIYNGVQILFAELDSPVLKAERDILSFSLLLNTEGTALQIKLKTLMQFVKQKIIFSLDKRVKRSTEFKQ